MYIFIYTYNYPTSCIQYEKYPSRISFFRPAPHFARVARLWQPRHGCGEIPYGYVSMLEIRHWISTRIANIRFGSKTDFLSSGLLFSRHELLL